MTKPTFSSQRECEIKFQLKDLQTENEIKEILSKHMFFRHEEQLESDLVVDTFDFLCRSNGILLRFRYIYTPAYSDILITLKFKENKTGTFKDGHELQYLFSSFNNRIFEKINTILKQNVGVQIPIEVHNYKDIDSIQKYLFKVGFQEIRTLIEKKRTMYTKDSVTVTFDIFPKNIGTYLEIEAHSPKKLYQMVNLLKLSYEELIAVDYGDIVKEKQNKLSEKLRRICTFN